MKFPLQGSDQLQFSTVRLEAESALGSTSVGTAFFLEFNTAMGARVPCLVTNKHVIESAVRGKFLLHTAVHGEAGNVVGIGKSVTVELTDFADQWTGHPDKEIDLCAMPIAPLIAQALVAGHTIFYVGLHESHIKDDLVLEELFAITNVFMIGYPIGLWDTNNNHPLIRRGITATHPHADFEGKSVGCIDIAALPGSSGSPILIFDEGTFATRDGPKVGTRSMLLGILFAGPQMRVDGTVRIVTIPTSGASVTTTNIPTHLGYYIKARELLNLKKFLFQKLDLA